jgi:response regulator RpfG family c-di-GMP phosphodiesterase
MKEDLKEDRLEYDFLIDDVVELNHTSGHYKVIIADDDVEIHNVTRMILKNFEFEGRTLMLIDAYSGKEAKEMLEAHPDTALIFLDVVMEKSDSGLEVVEYLRRELKNEMTRIVLRTGQPGEAPEDRIIKDYDINDYRLKTELTVSRLNTTIYSALRNYRDLMKIERNRRGLEKIIETSAKLFENNHLNEFLTSILHQMSSFKLDNGDMVFLHEIDKLSSGIITMEKGSNQLVVVAATGKYEAFIGKDICDVPELSNLRNEMKASLIPENHISVIKNGFIIQNSSPTGPNNYIYIEGNEEQFDFELIALFLSNYSAALDNYVLNNMITRTQKEIILTLGEVVEHHFDDTGGHVRRISEMMYRFSLLNNFSYSESELVKVASTMHDVGKIAISENVLEKRGRLTEEEFKLIQEHSNIGYNILKKSELEIMKIAAEIALYHHEKYDGSGYPLGIKGKEIPLRARMMAIVDVYDALTHKRIYKEASSKEEAIAYLNSEKDKQFDAKLVDLFMENLDELIEGLA